jgi:hypothetical protein
VTIEVWISNCYYYYGGMIVMSNAILVQICSIFYKSCVCPVSNLLMQDEITQLSQNIIFFHPEL